MVVRVAARRNKELHREFVARQQALHSLRFGAQVKSADLEVTIEEKGIRSRVVNEPAGPYNARGINDAANL
jgi:hypothetical protein